MNEQVQQALCAMVAENGAAIAADAGRCEALLRERCPANKRELTLLLGVLRSGVMSELLRPAAGAAAVGRVGSLARRVEEEMGVKADAARWAVESWALALGWPLGVASPPAPAVAAAPIRSPAPVFEPGPAPAPPEAVQEPLPASRPAAPAPEPEPEPVPEAAVEPAPVPLPEAAHSGAPRRAGQVWIAVAVVITAALLYTLWRWLQR